ncbi:hypothetical protein L596_013134 [Steinernema carpocapsae]|uniref:Uncharacterized protein n=1 Tax=Steinernema carpocapsae TaxID=34508 RepID=A0A4U5NZ91_STECR|nr:hypothetical protein L596_013134 [Steinernema carpocapsae]
MLTLTSKTLSKQNHSNVTNYRVKKARPRPFHLVRPREPVASCNCVATTEISKIENVTEAILALPLPRFNMPRFALAAALLALFVAAISGEGTTKEPGKDEISSCEALKNAEYKIAFFLNEITFETNFTGAEINLLKWYNDWARQQKVVTENFQTGRLLLGYDNNYVVLPYEAGKLSGSGRATFFDAHDNETVSINGYKRSEGEVNFTSKAIKVDCEVDPAEVTSFHDIVFAGKKRIDLNTNKDAVDIDSNIIYTKGNHFDLKNWISVKGENGTKKLIGVVDGRQILRTQCPSKTEASYVNIDCSREPCKKSASIRPPDEEDLLYCYCFSVDGCDIAYGPKGLFDTILVIPKEPITKPVLLTITVPPTNQGITVTGGELMVNEGANATDGTDSNSTTAVEPAAETTKKKPTVKNPAILIASSTICGIVIVGTLVGLTIYCVVAHKREEELEKEKESSSATSREAASQGLRKRTSV